MHGLRPLSLESHSVPLLATHRVCVLLREERDYVSTFSLYSYVITPHHGMDYVVQDDVHNLSIRGDINGVNNGDQNGVRK